MNSWYAINCKVRGEHTAFVHLTRQGFRVYLPRYKKKRSHARRVDYVAAPLFPRYLFVNMDSESANWRAIRSTVGVVDIVCSGNRPSVVPEGVVEEILGREDKDGMVTLSGVDKFMAGDRISVSSGPFCDLSGIFASATDEDRVIVFLNLMGRQVKMHMPVEAISTAL